MMHFTYEELQYMLIMLSEGQSKINESEYFKGFHDIQIQERVIGKVRNKCWDIIKQLKQDK